MDHRNIVLKTLRVFIGHMGFASFDLSVFFPLTVEHRSANCHQCTKSPVHFVRVQHIGGNQRSPRAARIDIVYLRTSK